MSSTNYNKTYGGRKSDAPSNRNHLRVILIFVLVVLIVASLVAVFAKRSSANRKPAPVVTAESAVSPAPVEAKPVAPAPVAATSDQPAKKTPAPVEAKPAVTPAASAPTPVPSSSAVPPVVPVATAAVNTSPASNDPALNALLNKAEARFNSDQLAEARKWAEQALALCKTQEQPEWLAAARLLSKINIKIITTDFPFPEKKQRYEVQTGDALQKIAKKFNTTVESIQRSNGLKSYDQNIWDGQTLIIYKGEWSIKVDKKRYRLLLMDGETLFKVYDISIGRQGRTPTGNFQVVSKISEPDWYSPQGKVPFGSKENVLGTRWLKLQGMDQENRSLKGYGIHGTWERDSIGKDRSNGCIRMLNEDVEELYSIIPLKIPVVIAD